jgi:hypothetical protein
MAITVSSPQTPLWAELVQLVPIVSFALPFIVQGSVDLAQARFGFVVAASLTIPVTAVVLARRRVLNPILVGTALWLWLGAIAFAVPVPLLASWLSQTQGLGIFVLAFVVGAVFTFALPLGYVACHSSDSRWLRRASLGLLGLTLLLIAWSWWFRADVRVGGGLPFIALNVARRVLGRFAPAD